MKTPPNTFRQALARGERQIGLWMGLATPYAAELCAGSGFDWLVIDGEHAPNDLRTMLATLQAVAPYPVHPVVRLPHGDAALIKQVLEIGATTLLVPMVESAAMARDLASATRYPPQGTRGVGSGLARSSRWNRYEDYLHAANDTTCLLVQVETADALAQVDEIAAVDGVHGVFIGPADLAASMGRLGQATHPDVRTAIEDGVARIRRAGKAAGILCVDETLATHYLDLGVTFIAVGIDTTLLANASRALAAKFAVSDASTPEKG
ncbi:2,4-dihydroxyhept-2-ene-1,7-dioic acid aldolase [Pandoraea anapnoica]|uniref:2,4-dihydroxyhept-2-ene-1,7-dioic acid aldolase n=1 Tax=Pandoraea anapnoica TaxID=2508301 RepID=A0A5E5ASR2_9BURK|nr:4-hydroxy-2-oxoheptanedioate aldolase [Pandoraea anapnoica]VVE76037.1 2,4-dihydroxyhept-2-ene-1,7-dioic acid aldolase [Pandoraea anapnoica]